ncbi:alpha-D-ribose 1-methylphosphonate 5-triphosphate diphosphatase [Bradyrhizobium sp. G127]|uniref:alpha-D-ribose 1-methylphosphonate 5-triphosphate diphosphatase n=1 Tax=Bradyrhizobium sp. G127 TaxID=2904800 RepID=UPI001F43E41B|nr:alpha-D-ribose 1-methylphosphonate 5-triphosphate diphosphatase [Bradyrhizobium sp. G127]MCF2524588.1 alpha-D-ribose 1-methylphosphonate 5-triphosphate diphosphatase [Bradyrhizobium sp. G127]
MPDILIEGGRTLIGDALEDASIHIAHGTITEVSSRGSAASLRLDSHGLIALPGIVDMHGDAFERQMMPRPGVDFPVDVALVDSDRQAIANGITTVFHATTWSWEPGLRGTENAHRLLDAIEGMRPQLAADTRFHLRQETFNLDAEPTIAEWLTAGRVDLLAFNDHMHMTAASMNNPKKRARMVERSGLGETEFDLLVERVMTGADKVPASIARLASIGRDNGVPLLSHDDESPDQRTHFRSLGIAVAEFPINEATARAAVEGGDFTVFGAPNVVRGGSHTGWISAAEMVSKGLCSILASDYYYPAPLLAAFRLAADDILPLPQAWALVSRAPAAATELHDRGQIAAGKRADILLVDAGEPLRPRVVAVIAGGRMVHLTEPQRILSTSAAERRVEPA